MHIRTCSTRMMVDTLLNAWVAVFSAGNATLPHRAGVRMSLQYYLTLTVSMSQM